LKARTRSGKRSRIKDQGSKIKDQGSRIPDPCCRIFIASEKHNLNSNGHSDKWKSSGGDALSVVPERSRRIAEGSVLFVATTGIPTNGKAPEERNLGSGLNTQMPGGQTGSNRGQRPTAKSTMPES